VESPSLPIPAIPVHLAWPARLILLEASVQKPLFIDAEDVTDGIKRAENGSLLTWKAAN
jgi:hypothetical protein